MRACKLLTHRNMSRNTSLSQLFNEFSAFIVTFNIMIIANRYQNIHTINTLSMPCSECHAIHAECYCRRSVYVLSADINWLLLLSLLLLLLDEVNVHSSFFSQRISYKQKRLREISFAHTHKRETCTSKDA